MVQSLWLYVDDSGDRGAQHFPGVSTRLFALGGVLVAEEDRDLVKAEIDAFRKKWERQIGTSPLHSQEIRKKKGPFIWMRDRNLAQPFLDDLEALVVACPIIVNACVIDRAGYAQRYFEKYAPHERWPLCKTAFSILLERSAKFAASMGRMLRVRIEKTNSITDRTLSVYFDELKRGGMPFSAEGMASYAPLGEADFRHSLYELKFVEKSSRIMQLADVCLYPVCSKSGRAYEHLQRHGKLIDSHLLAGDPTLLGIKYSCFPPGDSQLVLPAQEPPNDNADDSVKSAS